MPLFRIALCFLACLIAPRAAFALDEGLGGSLRVGLGASGALRLESPPSRTTLQGFGDDGRAVTPELPLTVACSFTAGKQGVTCSAASQSAALWLVSPPVGAHCRLGGRLLPGLLEVTPQGKRVRAVNVLPLEDYVTGVLRLEGSPSLQPEALRALAVAVRTYAERSRGKHAAEGFDLCGTTHCQGYRGMDPAAGWAREAASSTSGLILVHDGRPIAAVYSSDCGGSTANNEDVGMGRSPWPYLRGVRDAETEEGEDYCRKGRFHRWTLVVTPAELSRRVKPPPEARNGRLVLVETEAPDRWGRPARCRLTWEVPPPPARKPGNRAAPSASQQAGREPTRPTRVSKVVSLSALRQALGPDRLRSTFVEVFPLANGSFEFRGRGHGHGVGLCAAGANGMASPPHRRGFQEILGHYYTGAELVALHEWLEAGELEAASDRTARGGEAPLR